jgi:predicted Zn finger-like uncharacterized protein
MFRVVPDQLRISEGWVRCGKCDEVFDANAHLRSLEEALSKPPEPTQEPQPQPEPLVAEEPPQNAYAATQLAPMHLQAEPVYDWGPILPEPVAQPEPEPEPTPVPAPQAYSLQTDTLLDPGPPDLPMAVEQEDLLSSSAPADDWAPTLHAGLEPLDGGPELGTYPRMDAMADDPLPSFMAAGTKSALTNRWLGRKTLLAACTLLALLLLGQVLLQERDRIAAAAPPLQPLLVAGCEVLACTVSAPREIESIAIDSSAFTSVRPGVYLLHVSLKNAATVALATPALELTLTDTQDRPLLRRVVQPAELSGASSMAGGAELGANLPINVKPGATAEKITGYKLLAFYP